MNTPSKPRTRRASGILLAGLLLGLGITAHLLLKKPVMSNPASAPSFARPHKTAEVTPKSIEVGLPVRLKIPKIKVDATIDQVGLTTNGELGVPKSPASAAWYDLGPRPGEVGSAVINGHFGYKNYAAVFDNLHTLQKDDLVYVEDERGTTVAFVVRESRTYRPDEDTASVLAASDGKAHLNLITCQGVWDSAQGSFSARLVVFTDKAEKKL